jgi:hypothetical protein
VVDQLMAPPDVLVRAFAIIGGALFLVQLAGGLVTINRASLPPGLPFGDRIRQSLLKAGGTHGRRWVEHPWVMSLAFVGLWIAGSLVLAARMWVYSR